MWFLIVNTDLYVLVWKVGAKRAGLENELGVAKDWVNPAISQSITIAKDMVSSSV